MIKLVILAVLITSFNTYSQDDETDKIVQQFLNQRKVMIEEIMDAFDDDVFLKNRFTDDTLFDALRKKGFSALPNSRHSNDNVKVEEKAQKDGSILVIITPKNKKIKLDIKTDNNN